MYVFQYTVLYIIPSCLINSALDVLDVMIINMMMYDDALNFLNHASIILKIYLNMENLFHDFHEMKLK